MPNVPSVHLTSLKNWVGPATQGLEMFGADTCSHKVRRNFKRISDFCGNWFSNLAQQPMTNFPILHSSLQTIYDQMSFFQATLLTSGWKMTPHTLFLVNMNNFHIKVVINARKRAFTQDLGHLLASSEWNTQQSPLESQTPCLWLNHAWNGLSYTGFQSLYTSQEKNSPNTLPMCQSKTWSVWKKISSHDCKMHQVRWFGSESTRRAQQMAR